MIAKMKVDASEHETGRIKIFFSDDPLDYLTIQCVGIDNKIELQGTRPIQIQPWMANQVYIKMERER